MMVEKISAIAAGHICLDVIPNMDHLPEGQFDHLFLPGHLISVGPAAFSTGGPVSNTGLALYRLGIPTTLVAKVGADMFGQIVTRLVENFNPNLAGGLIASPESPTSYTVIINPPGTDRIFLHCPGANDSFCAADIDPAVLAGVSLFQFGYPPLMRRMYADGGFELSELMRRAKATGVSTALDMAFPDPSSDAGRANWPAILKMALPYVDVFLPSIEEILFMLRRETYDRLQREAPGGKIVAAVTPELLSDLSGELMDMGARMVALKLGDRGLYLRTGSADAVGAMGRAAPADIQAWTNQELWAPCFKVQVAGTTGSGDATIAGLLSALLRDFSPRQAVTAAVAVGACNVEAPDALSGLRSWEETLARVASGWERLPVQVSGAGWSWGEQDQVWVGPGTR
jgi:sugar/nucleoside kinase (ribokinase family)